MSSSALSDIKHETQSSVLCYSDKADTVSILNGLKNEQYLFICEVIFKITVV